jgi:hypothetical protein
MVEYILLKDNTQMNQMILIEKKLVEYMNLEGFIQESTVYNKKVTIMNMLVIIGAFLYAKYLITA